MVIPPDYPITASMFLLLSVFVGALILFHVLFVRVWRLSKVTWKRVDYIWLSIAIVGLIGISTEARREAAATLVGARMSQLDSVYRSLHFQLRIMSSDRRCEQTLMDNLSPGNQNISRQYASVCSYAGSLYKQIPDYPVANLDVHLFNVGKPIVTDPDLVERLKDLESWVAAYTRIVNLFNSDLSARGRTPVERFLALMAPFLLAVALALRITKVTGEIRLEQRS